ncbi:hypothetical protein WMY93_005806 [Mugilogobius chulae]|uniref:ATP-dependent DNA helicase n=1 Tax=Mugilogobius chulae TaxID=88201 RepID=A0AAW0PU25_9GOBI
MPKPDPVRSQKLSRIGPGQYSDGRPQKNLRSLEIDVRNAAVNRRVSKCVLLATGNDTCSRGQTLKKARGDFHELLKTVTRLCPKTCVVDFPPRHNHVSVAKQNRFRRAYQVETELAKLEYVSCVEEFPMNNLRLWAHDATHLSHPDGMQVLTDLICKAIRILSVVEPAPPSPERPALSLPPLRGLLMWLSSVAHRKLSAPSLVLQRQTQKVGKQSERFPTKSCHHQRGCRAKGQGLSPIPVSSGQFDVLAAPQKTPKNPASLARSKVTQPGAVVPRQPKRPLKTEVAVPSRPAVNTVTTKPQDQPVEPTVKRTSIAADHSTTDHTAVPVKAKAVAVTPRPTEVKSDVAVMTSNKFAEKTTTWADKVKSPPSSTCAKVPLTSDWNPYIVVKKLKTKKIVRPMVNTSSTTVKTGSTIQQNRQVQSDMTMMTSGAGASKTNATSKTEKVPVKRASCGSSKPVVKLQRLSHEDCKGKAPEAPSAAPVVQLQRLQNDDSGAKFTHLENIVGSFHQGEAIFSAISRGRQCTANALAAIVRHTHVRNVLEWSQEDLNKVLQEDSHARSKSGMVDGGGKSVVVFLKSLSEVHDHINQLAAGFGAGNAEFELSSVAVSLKDHKSECKDVSVEVVTVGSESDCESDKEGKQVCVEVVTVDSESDCESLREEEHVVVTMESEFESENADVAMEIENANKIEHVSDGVTFVGSANETECERMIEMMAVDTVSDGENVCLSVKVESPTVIALNTNSTGSKAWDTRSSTKGNVPEVGHKRGRTENDSLVSPLAKKNRKANKRKRAKAALNRTTSPNSQGVNKAKVFDADDIFPENNHYYKDIEINQDWNNEFAKEEENSPEERVSTEEDIQLEDKQTEEESNANTNKGTSPMKKRMKHSMIDRTTAFTKTLAPCPSTLYMSEVQQVVQQVSVASRKGHANPTSQKETGTDHTDSLEDIIKTDEGYRFLRPIRGTPAYWEEPLGKINDFWYRVEFQQRGSPHVHVFLFGDGPEIGKNTDEEVAAFIDKYITCKIPTNDQHLADIVTSVQQHSQRHSKTCRKKNTVCRFNFPRPVSERTFITRRKEKPKCPKCQGDTASKSQEENEVECICSQYEQNFMKEEKAVEILAAVKEALLNKDKPVSNIQQLFGLVGITQEIWEKALKSVEKRTQIILKRDVNEIWINPYNPFLLKCWNANMDIQYVTDVYACIVYIISYMSKSEREMGLVLRKTQEEATKHGNTDAKEAMKKIGQAYLHNRDVSAQEAVYRITNMHLKESSRGTAFIPTEDAWCQLCPEQEAERLEAAIELEQSKEDDEGPLLSIPDLGIAGKDICHLEKQLNVMTRAEGLDLIRSLNEQQLSIFHQIQRWCIDKASGNNPDPINVFVTGGAGTGKSHLIRAIQYEANRLFAPTRHHPDNINVLLTAPTGMAAHNLNASTIHSAFSIGINVTLPYLPLGEEKLNSLRAKFVDLQIVIIDEISMVSHDLLIYIHSRLRQIKQRSDFSPFGNVSVIAVGDFYQLAPVMAKGLYTENLPVNLWSSFKIAELTTVVRQKDTTFAELLNRLRTRSKGEPMLQNDIEILKSRETGEQSSALHIFPTNTQVSDHNINQLKITCPDSITIEAQDYHYNKKTGKMEKRLTPHTKDNLTCLPRELPLGVSARVMLCKNIDVEDGLVNGVCGTVTHITDKEINGLPEAVYVQFDGVRVGTQRRKKCPPTTAALRNSTRIEPEEERANSKGVKRRQFPLSLAWAVTVHKVQGLTVDNAVVSLNKMFAAGQAYVALSRVTTLDGLIIQDFKEKAIYCNEDVKNALQVMPRFMENTMSQDKQATDVLTLFLINVQGLLKHVFDLVSCTQTLQPECIAVTETWLTSQSSLHTVDIKGYNFHSQPRSLSYENNHDEHLCQENNRSYKEVCEANLSPPQLIAGYSDEASTWAMKSWTIGRTTSRGQVDNEGLRTHF